MGFPTLYNVPTDDSEMARFAFENRMHHMAIDDTLSSKGVRPLGYVLEPIFQSDMTAWLLRHQEVHNLMNGALGLEGNDLTTVDFNDKGQVASWINLHANEHYLVAQSLKL